MPERTKNGLAHKKLKYYFNFLAFKNDFFMANIQPSSRLSAFLAVATLLGAIALPLMTIAIWLFWDQLAPLAAGNRGITADLTSLSAGARFTGFGLFMAGAALQSYGLLGLRRTFLEAANGRSLSTNAVNGFRRFAWVSLIMVPIGIVQQAGLSVIISLNDPTPGGSLSLQLGTPEISRFFMALLLVFVAHVFAEGKQMKDENEAFL